MAGEPLTGCGVNPFMVVCTYRGIGTCFYPSGPCLHGKEGKVKEGERCQYMPYSEHLHKEDK